ncbi:Uncharacterized mitochondrial protein AtMg00310 [Linum perenne]
MKLILSRYCRISGQEVNGNKSALFFSANTPEDQQREIAAVFGVNVDASLGSYLGLPTDWGSTKKETFRYILERLTTKAQAWKSAILSQGGREVMIKAILQAIPAYVFACFKLPVSLIKKMDAILMNFWRAGDGSKKSIHWIAAGKITSDKEHGGLGFKSFTEFNKAFLAKLAWKILLQPEALWVKLLKGLYFPRADFVNTPPHYRPSWLWSGILEGRNALLTGLRRNIGNGQSTQINDPWIPDAREFRSQVDPLLNCRVSDFIMLPQRRWDEQKL